MRCIDISLDYAPPVPLARARSFFFNVGLAGFGAWLLMAAYLILYLKYYKKINVEWEEYWPNAIPIATTCAVGSLIACAPRRPLQAPPASEPSLPPRGCRCWNRDPIRHANAGPACTRPAGSAWPSGPYGGG